MTLLVIYLAICLGSAAITATQDSLTQQTQSCDRYYDVNPAGLQSDAKFTLLPLNDVMFSQNVLSEVLSKSAIDCGHTCVDAEGCVMLTFQRGENVASGRCRIYGQVHNATDENTILTGARSYVLDMEAFGRLHNGYAMRSGYCIRVLSELVVYQSAAQRCLQLDGGHILFAKTTEQLQFANDIKQEEGFVHMLLGADDLEKEGQFKWMDGSSLPSNSPLWYPGKPNNYKGNEDCVCLLTTFGKLDDCPCATPYGAVCQRDV